MPLNLNFVNHCGTLRLKIWCFSSTTPQCTATVLLSWKVSWSPLLVWKDVCLFARACFQRPWHRIRFRTGYSKLKWFTANRLFWIVCFHTSRFHIPGSQLAGSQVFSEQPACWQPGLQVLSEQPACWQPGLQVFAGQPACWQPGLCGSALFNCLRQKLLAEMYFGSHLSGRGELWRTSRCCRVVTCTSHQCKTQQKWKWMRLSQIARRQNRFLGVIIIPNFWDQLIETRCVLWPAVGCDATEYSKIISLSTSHRPNESSWSLLIIIFVEAAGGVDIVKKIVTNLTHNTSIQRLALLDCHGYDAFPALAAMEVAFVANKVFWS